MHLSVLLSETIDLLAPASGDRVLDVTLGLGGHSEAMLQKIGTKGSLVALDADEENMKSAKERLKNDKRITFVHANFSELPECLPKDLQQFDVILADLGLSSPHIDDPLRGFTFRSDAPLDMRFDQSKGMSAAMLLASSDPDRLLTIFRDYGEIPRTRPFVEAIVKARSESSIATSDHLKKIVDDVYGFRAPRVLPQIFQALRIAVNDELGVLTHFLSVAPSLLAISGRLAIISYHSLEDRLVKQTFRELTTPIKDPLTGAIATEAPFELLARKPIFPSDTEVQKNPRSRSAVLRAIIKKTAYTSIRSPVC
jgi:16S rRNA (cytosine1402-N4)-methyltransferase